jgi:site-specific recombinase XerD
MPRPPTGSKRRVAGGVQARVTDPLTGKRKSLGVFPDDASADKALARALAAIDLGAFADPDAHRIKLSRYAADWIAERGLSDSTAEMYGTLFRLWIEPDLGTVAVGKLTPPVIRKWWTKITTADPTSHQPAKAYRLLHAICATAVADTLLRGNNPCMIRSAGVEHHEERPIATIHEVLAIADRVRPWHRLLVLMAAATGLRLGELAALQRADIDGKTVTVRRAYNKRRTATKEPKSAAGYRAVVMPAFLLPAVEHHLAHYVGAAPGALIFTGPNGGALHGSNWTVEYTGARTAAGVNPNLRFHDLRHTGNTWFAGTTADVGEIMERMGHASRRAADIYLHKQKDRQAELVEAMNTLIEEEMAKPRTNVVGIGRR